MYLSPRALSVSLATPHFTVSTHHQRPAALSLGSIDHICIMLSSNSGREVSPSTKIKNRPTTTLNQFYWHSNTTHLPPWHPHTQCRSLSLSPFPFRTSCLVKASKGQVPSTVQPTPLGPVERALLGTCWGGSPYYAWPARGIQSLRIDFSHKSQALSLLGFLSALARKEILGPGPQRQELRW